MLLSYIIPFREAFAGEHQPEATEQNEQHQQLQHQRALHFLLLGTVRNREFL